MQPPKIYIHTGCFRLAEIHIGAWNTSVSVLKASYQYSSLLPAFLEIIHCFDLHKLLCFGQAIPVYIARKLLFKCFVVGAWF